jgi:leader peptidase (prepilin peptidase) / N-methyltransferase
VRLVGGVGSGESAPDSRRNDIIEGSLAGATGLIVVATSLYAAPGLEGAAGGGLGLIMLAVALIDSRLLVIPDGLGASAFVLGLAETAFEHWREMPAPALDSLIRAAAMSAAFFVFRFAYRRLRGREGMGLGDVKLAGVAGVWLDWPSLPIAVEIAALGALGFVAWRLILTRRAPDPSAKLPFGTFFAPAIWICWLVERWWNWPF